MPTVAMGRDLSLPTNSSTTGPQRVPLPTGGVASASTYADQPQKFLPPQTTRNIRPFDTISDRPRLGTAPGIVKLIAQTFGNGTPIQALDTVSRASVIAGYHLGDHARILGRNSLASPVAGNVFGFQAAAVPGLDWEATVDVSAESGAPSTVSIASVARHPDTDLVVVGTAQYTHDADPNKVVRVVAFDRYGVQVWSTLIARSGTDLFINTVECSRLYTLVTVNESVYALRNDTGAIAGSTNCNGWSDECVEARVWRDAAGQEFMYVLFNGKTAAATLPNGGSVTSGFYGKCFRSGVMKFLITSDDYAIVPIFSQLQWGRQLAATDTYFEATHGYFRFSENSELKPRGAIVNALGIDPFGNIVVGRCNAGGGPTSAFTPDLQLMRPISVCFISVSGVMVWEKDVNSIGNRIGAQGVLNDIPAGAGIDPTVNAVRADGTQVYAAGSPNSATECVWALLSSSGSLVWTQILEPTVGPPDQAIRQAAMALDPTDGNLVLCGDSSTAWPGTNGTSAHTWKLNAVDGSVVWTESLSGTASATGVAFFSDGRMVISTDTI